jgi:Fur family peroxide stress response transcriptional regulator
LDDAPKSPPTIRFSTPLLAQAVRKLVDNNLHLHYIYRGNQVANSQDDRRLKEAELLCRKRGLRLTVQRRAVLQAVLQRTDHPTAEQIFDALHRRLPGLSLATIYRILDKLVSVGVVRHLYHTGMPVRFDSTMQRHDHFTCTRCGKVVDLHSPTLDNLPLPEELPEGYQIEQYSVQFYGLCADCRPKRKAR